MREPRLLPRLISRAAQGRGGAHGGRGARGRGGHLCRENVSLFRQAGDSITCPRWRGRRWRRRVHVPGLIQARRHLRAGREGQREWERAGLRLM